MPTYHTGNMWTAFNQVHHFTVTTNAFIKNNGALVMGAGIAKQVRDQFPGVDLELGSLIRSWGPEYGFRKGTGPLAVFQVKHHFKDHADLELITLSANMMAADALENPTKIYALNYPGIGNGKLQMAQVKPIIEQLPVNVHIWTFN